MNNDKEYLRDLAASIVSVLLNYREVSLLVEEGLRAALQDQREQNKVQDHADN